MRKCVTLLYTRAYGSYSAYNRIVKWERFFIRCKRHVPQRKNKRNLRKYLCIQYDKHYIEKKFSKKKKSEIIIIILSTETFELSYHSSRYQIYYNWNRIWKEKLFPSSAYFWTWLIAAKIVSNDHIFQLYNLLEDVRSMEQ